MTTKTTFLLAETTPARFADLTGLVQGRGFVLHGVRNLPGGLYPESYAEDLIVRLIEAGIKPLPVPAKSVTEGLYTLASLGF